MSGFFKNDRRRLESELRARRPEAPADLVSGLARRLESTRPTGVPRLALAGLMSALMLVALGAVGGISYAANAAKEAAQVVKQAVAPTAQNATIKVTGLNAGGDQYRPGFGFGDPNHNHTGPPGLNRGGAGAAAPPIRARNAPKGKNNKVTAKLVSFAIVLDEQAALRISVFDADDNKLLLTQGKGANIGAGIKGPQTKTLRYTVNVPRAIPITLRIPANLLVPGKTYTVRVQATDPDGNKTILNIPFIA